MPYEPYVSAEDYVTSYGGNLLPDKERDKYLKSASRHVDALTFNRINGKGFENLTGFQQEMIKEVVCLQAEFEYENMDELESIFSSYSINGVSMSFNESWKIEIQQGVAMKKDVYSFLVQTGLTCRLLR